MNLMLAVVLACVILGLVAREFGRREHVAIVTLSLTMTALYFLVPRFM